MDTLEFARGELDELLNEEAQIEFRLKEIRGRSEILRKAVLGLSALIGEDAEEESLGITDAIRGVVERRKEFMVSPMSVRGLLRSADFPVSKYKNALAVIHTTLKRLEEQGEVRPIEKDGKTYYQWIERETAITDDDIPF